MDGWLQGYNAQAATNEQQIVVAAEVMVSSPDFGHLEPMFAATGRELKAAGVTEVPEVLLADAGYWHHEQMERIMATGTQVLGPTGLEPPPRQEHPPGLGRRPLRLHAPGPEHRSRQRALRQTATDDRARLRPHEVQPQDHQIPPTEAEPPPGPSGG